MILQFISLFFSFFGQLSLDLFFLLLVIDLMLPKGTFKTACRYLVYEITLVLQCFFLLRQLCTLCLSVEFFLVLEVEWLGRFDLPVSFLASLELCLPLLRLLLYLIQRFFVPAKLLISKALLQLFLVFLLLLIVTLVLFVSFLTAHLFPLLSLLFILFQLLE